MLKLVNIKKDYKVADMTVKALKGVNICFRKNEFVAILGPSGCGKTTLLNIIGGLDQYTSGDLAIFGKSTKDFRDRDWDVYRNHRIGFVFQSYNLIPHQTVLGNVELSLTISGIGKAERIERAKKALDKVGLSDQYHKRPNQLSGGQCQRVAIARSLVNDPEILLADEPTGALDTATSKQIMELIKEIAKERLVIMVTHNPELADEYSTRKIRLLDGNLLSDSNPFTEEEERKETESKPKEEKDNLNNKAKKKEKAKMSFWTAFKLSLYNLFTKKRRTLMTCIAGSIGIIGVSMVLSISYGVQGYIDNMQNDMLSGNPIEISESDFDISALMSSGTVDQVKFLKEHGWANVDSMMQTIVDQANRMENMFIQNNIDQSYVDFIKAIPPQYLAALFFDYGLDVSNNIYTGFKETKAGPDKDISLSGIKAIYGSILGETEFAKYSSLINSIDLSLQQAPDAEDYILSQYNLLNDEKITSRLPKEKNEIMIVLNKDRAVADLLLAQLGYFSQEEFINLIYKITEDERYDKNLYNEKISYEALVGKTFKWYSNDSIFTKTIDKNFSYDAYHSANNFIELKVVGLLEPKEKMSYGMLSSGIYYTTSFAEYAIGINKNSELAKGLTEDNTSYNSSSILVAANVLYPGSPEMVRHSGISFEYSYNFNGKTNNATGLVGNQDRMSLLAGLMGESSTGDFKTLAATSFSLQELGGKNLPNRICVYPLDFNQKELVLKYLDQWNSDKDIELNGVVYKAENREHITYTDNLSIIISLIKSLVQMITIALIGFTSLALIVSCVMIGIITYVSVVERIKEIGVIRSLGGRKRDVSNLFTAETFIIGFVSGLIGIFITYLLSGLINLAVRSFTDIDSIAVFPISYAIIMMILSIFLTLLSGLMPSRSAAKKDPVVALRTE